MRGLTFSEGEFYHLYNRGVDKRAVFTDESEYKSFMLYLRHLNNIETPRITYQIASGQLIIDEAKPRQKEPLIAIGAFCLMPNHFHIYATPLVENGISKFMHRLQTAYTMRFNEAHERSGSLFQGTFKATHIDSDVYANYLFSYIHLNPAKLVDPSWKERGARDIHSIKNFVRNYPYSSIAEYLAGRHIITDPSKFPDYLSTKKDIREHINAWLRARDEIDEA